MKTQNGAHLVALAVGVAGLVALAAPAQATAEKVVVDSTALRARLEAALKNLESVDGFAGKTKGKARKDLRASTDAARDEIEAALEVLGSAEPALAPEPKARSGAATSAPVDKEVLVYRSGTGLEPVPHGGAPAGAVVLRPYGPKKLESLVREIGLRTTLEEKRDLVARRTEKYYFTCGEAEAILRAFDFDKDRVKVAEILWPVIVDPTHFETVIEVLSSNKAKKKLRAAIGWAD